MEKANVIEDLKYIFRKVLKKNDILLSEETTAADIDGWDSITNVLLISEIEKHYDIRFSFREILKFANVGDLCSAVIKKVG